MIPSRTPTELVLCEFTAPRDPALETWSPFCLKVRRALAAAGLGFTTRHARDPAAYAELNPVGQVPILLADGQPITDSTRILAAIRQWTGRPEVDARTAAEIVLYEELADTALNGFVVAARWADPENWSRVRPAFFGPAPDAVVDPMRARVIGALNARDVWRAGPEACWQRFADLLDALDARAPEAGFWLADVLTAADFALFGQLQSLRMGITPKQAAQVEARGRLVGWLDRVDAATRG